MIRQSFTEKQILESAQRFGFEIDTEPSVTILATRRGSAAKVITKAGIILMKYADLQRVSTEQDIFPSRSAGLRNEVAQTRRLGAILAPRLLGYFDEPQAVCLATEFVKGSMISIAAQDAPANRKKIVNDLLHTVYTLHEKGVLHGDLQPANAIVNPSRELTLIDFEFSHEFDQPSLGPGLHYNLPREVAQQIIDGKNPELKQREETFALTATCLSLLTLRPPVDTGASNMRQIDNLRVIADNPQYSTLGAAESDLPLAKALVYILEASPSERPETPYELFEILEPHDIHNPRIEV